MCLMQDAACAVVMLSNKTYGKEVYEKFEKSQNFNLIRSIAIIIYQFIIDLEQFIFSK